MVQLAYREGCICGAHRDRGTDDPLAGLEGDQAEAEVRPELDPLAHVLGEALGVGAGVGAGEHRARLALDFTVPSGTASSFAISSICDLKATLYGTSISSPLISLATTVY